METVKQLRRDIEDIEDMLAAQHGKHTPSCEVLHLELGLPQTQRDDADAVIERAQAQAGEQRIDLEPDSIKLTIEHEDLHELLRRVVVDSVSKSEDATLLAARMLAVGRIMGMREASGLLGGNDNELLG